MFPMSESAAEVNPLFVFAYVFAYASPQFLPGGNLVGSVTGNIGGQGSVEYYEFLWAGGAFSASASIPDAGALAPYLFSAGVSGTCTSAGSATLNSGDSFTGTIAIPNLAAGSYCIGLDVNGLSDPSYSLTFNTPVNGAVPEPSTFVLLAAGLGLIGSLGMKKRNAAHIFFDSTVKSTISPAVFG
jgi:hypothetical protein